MEQYTKNKAINTQITISLKKSKNKTLNKKKTIRAIKQMTDFVSCVHLMKKKI
jgi:hypothetical protein